ncbi:hypothetical protein [Nocardia sp. NPDC059239]|uniref:hypothetical protein n=1 Tax=Nocardia sp. NPDC059239 TaxID=3346785 RepID=UPI0036A32E85
MEVLAAVRAHAQIAGPNTTLPDKLAKAIEAALARKSRTADDLDLVEINEAFASVTAHSAALLEVPCRWENARQSPARVSTFDSGRMPSS